MRGLWTKGTKLARYGAFLPRCKLTKKGTFVCFLPGTVCSVSLAFLHGGALKRQFWGRKTKWSPKFRFELILASCEMTFCRWRKEHGGLCDRRDEQKGAPRKPPRCNYVFERPFIPYIFRTPPNLKPLNSAQPVKTPAQSLTALQYFHLQQDFSYFCLGQEFHSHNVSRLNLKQDEEDSSKISLVVTPRDRLGVGACLFFLGCALRV